MRKTTPIEVNFLLSKSISFLIRPDNQAFRKFLMVRGGENWDRKEPNSQSFSIASFFGLYGVNFAVKLSFLMKAMFQFQHCVYHC